MTSVEGRPAVFNLPWKVCRPVVCDLVPVLSLFERSCP